MATNGQFEYRDFEQDARGTGLLIPRGHIPHELRPVIQPKPRLQVAVDYIVRVIRGAEKPPAGSLQVERTARNFGHFVFNKRLKEFEVVYYGSAFVEQMLQTQLDIDSGPDARLWSFFDVNGGFHDQARVYDLALISPRSSHSGSTRHNAYFEIEDWNITLPVDYIYSLLPALPVESAASEPALLS